MHKKNDEKYTNNFNDKIMRQILKDKYQAAMSLNEWLNIKPEYEIKPEEIEEIKKCTGLSDEKIKELEKTLQSA